MKKIKQFLAKNKSKLKRKLNDIPGKIKTRSYIVFLLALLAILLLRMVWKNFFSYFIAHSKFINLNPSYISSITEKYSDFLGSKDIFLSIVDEVVYTFEVKLSNVIFQIDFVGNLLSQTFNESSGEILWVLLIIYIFQWNFSELSWFFRLSRKVLRLC